MEIVGRKNLVIGPPLLNLHLWSFFLLVVLVCYIFKPLAFVLLQGVVCFTFEVTLKRKESEVESLRRTRNGGWFPGCHQAVPGIH